MQRIWSQPREFFDDAAGPTERSAQATVGVPADDGVEMSQHRATLEKIKNLPAPIGVLLMGVGFVGVIMPGPVGTPLLLAGGLVLAPKAFGKVERFLAERFPGLHLTGMEAVGRFITDLEKRYPDPEGGQATNS